MGRACTITCLALVFSLNAFAISKQNKAKIRAYSRANKAYQKKRYRRSLSLLQKSFNFRAKKRKTPSKVYQLAAKNYERLKNYKAAISYIDFLIKKDHPKTNKKVMGKVASGQEDDLPEMNENLQFLYYKKSALYSRLFSQELYKRRGASTAVMNQYYANVKKYKKVCENLDEYECPETDRIIRIVEKRLDNKRKNRFGTKNYWSLSYMTWQDPLTIRRDSDGKQNPLIAATQGWAVGYNYSRKNEYTEYVLAADFFLGRATVDDNTDDLANVDYNQNGVPVLSVFIGPSYYWRIEAREVAFGLSLKYRYRTGNYTDTSQGGQDWRILKKIFTHGVVFLMLSMSSINFKLK
jgi:hypothetical protein